jgi:hypothetical protein
MANFKEGLTKIKAFIFDIDGVLSLQTISLNSFGVPNRTVTSGWLCTSAGSKKRIPCRDNIGKQFKEYLKG